MKHLLLVLLLSLALQGSANAQSPNRYGWVYGAFPTGYGWVTPRVSPVATVSQYVGVTEVMIRYSRPAVNGRDVWGALVPYDQVWRAGANEATVISFTGPVQVEGEALEAGTYALFTIPGEQTWTFIFSNRPHQWGAFGYTQAEDDLRVTVEAEPAEHREHLHYSIPVVTDSTAQVVLHWELLKIPFTVSVEAQEATRVLANQTFDWQAGFFAADYFYQGGTALEEGLRWVNASIAMEENATNMLLKARILGALRRDEEAIATAEHVKPIGPERMKQAAEELIASLRSRQE
jgi:hypothetical protein